ncbi:hypothetical protein Bealeia1_01172 [Candidatus Bealeia paramacronuclearis]|uniref:Uncharacterized protein n=1 Tax=Candidatus Bealeia paramacronuclearis TaxID=1921001 RepID=A0ABZ2C6D4_9PROT|nr:hypothetical protein [Candidatus Bealeia paramacronuclearis]
MKWFIRNDLPQNWPGHQLPDLLDLNEEEGLIDMTSDQESEIEILSENDLFPEKIVLRLKIAPVPYESFQIMGMSYLGNDYGKISIYEKTRVKAIAGVKISSDKALFQGIDLVETGRGWFETQGKRVDFTPFSEVQFVMERDTQAPLFRKLFGVVRNDLKISHDPQKRFLIPFGGLFYPGILPEEAQQVYCEVLKKQDQTFDLGFTSSSLWRERGILPPQPGDYEGKEIQFEGDLEDHLSLGAALVAGSAQFLVRLKSIPETKVYASQSYRIPGGHPELIEVTFVPK